MAGYIKQLLSKVSIAVAAGAAEQVGGRAASDWWQERKRRKAENDGEPPPSTTEDGKNFPPLKDVASKYWRRFQAKRESIAWMKQKEQDRLAKEVEDTGETPVEESNED